MTESRSAATSQALRTTLAAKEREIARLRATLGYVEMCLARPTNAAILGAVVRDIQKTLEG